MNARARVILPLWIWENANNKSEFKQNLAYYMQRYPGYEVIEVHKHYAICDKG